MTEGNPFLITPPPGIAPAPKAEPLLERNAAPEDFISLPPGIADSATHRMPAAAPAAVPATAPARVLQVAPVVPATPQASAASASEPVVFFPAPPGAVPPASVWRLMLASGIVVPLVSAVFIGRNPARLGENSSANLLPIDDPARSLSKTHALVERDGNQVFVTDLDSTNGVVIVPPGAEAFAAEPNERYAVVAGTELRLGSYVITLSH